jgi:hypothetical protein
MKAVQHLRQSRYTVASRINSASTLIAKLSRQTLASKTNVNHVKINVFSFKDGAPILPVDHLVYTDMAETVKVTCCVVLYVIFHSTSLTPTVCCRGRLDAYSFQRRTSSLGLPSSETVLILLKKLSPTVRPVLLGAGQWTQSTRKTDFAIILESCFIHPSHAIPQSGLFVIFLRKGTVAFSHLPRQKGNNCSNSMF